MYTDEVELIELDCIISALDHNLYIIYEDIESVNPCDDNKHSQLHYCCPWSIVATDHAPAGNKSAFQRAFRHNHNYFDVAGAIWSVPKPSTWLDN